MRLLIYILLIPTCLTAQPGSLLFQNFVTSETVIATPEIAYYMFSANTADSSGNGYDLTNSGATLTTDKGGNSNEAYFFDDNNDYMTLASTVDMDTVHSVCWRMEVDGVVSDFIRASGRLSTVYMNAVGTMVYRTGNGGGWEQVTLTYLSNLTLTNYYDFVITRSGNTVKLYRDKVLQDTETMSNNYSFEFDWLGANATWPLDGTIDNIRVYDRVINQDEIDAIADEE